MKKVLAAALFCAVSSFAAWDLFPVLPAGKGEAKVGFDYGMPGEKVSTMGLNLGARFSVIEGLEASVLLDGSQSASKIGGAGGYVISASNDGKDADYSGLDKPIVGLRFWLPAGLGIVADVALPFGSEDVAGKEPDLSLNAGVQFSPKINEQISLGAEALISKVFSDADNGLDLGITVEVDYSLGGPSTPFVAIDLQQGLTKGDKSEATKMTMGLSVGYTHDINETMYAQASFWIGLVGDAYKDYAPKTINVTYGLKF